MFSIVVSTMKLFRQNILDSISKNYHTKSRRPTIFVSFWVSPQKSRPIKMALLDIGWKMFTMLHYGRNACAPTAARGVIGRGV